MILTNEEFCSIRDQLNDDENEVIDMIAARVLEGRISYGPLSIDGDERDFLGEMMEEFVDAPVYATIQALQMRRILKKALDGEDKAVIKAAIELVKRLRDRSDFALYYIAERDLIEAAESHPEWEQMTIYVLQCKCGVCDFHEIHYTCKRCEDGYEVADEDLKMEKDKAVIKAAFENVEWAIAKGKDILGELMGAVMSHPDWEDK